MVPELCGSCFGPSRDSSVVTILARGERSHLRRTCRVARVLARPAESIDQSRALCRPLQLVPSGDGNVSTEPTTRPRVEGARLWSMCSSHCSSASQTASPPWPLFRACQMSAPELQTIQSKGSESKPPCCTPGARCASAVAVALEGLRLCRASSWGTHLESLGSLLKAEHADQPNADGGVLLHLRHQGFEDGDQGVEAVRCIQLHRDEVLSALGPPLGSACTDQVCGQAIRDIWSSREGVARAPELRSGMSESSLDGLGDLWPLVSLIVGGRFSGYGVLFRRAPAIGTAAVPLPGCEGGDGRAVL